MNDTMPTYKLDFGKRELNIGLTDASSLNVRFEYEPLPKWIFSTTREILWPNVIVAQKDGKVSRIERETDYGAGYPVNYYLFRGGFNRTAFDDQKVVAQIIKEAQRGRPSLRDYVDNAAKSFGTDVGQLSEQRRRFRGRLSDLRTHLSDSVTEREYLRILTGIFESDEMRGLVVGTIADSLEAKIGHISKRRKPSLEDYQGEFEIQLVRIATGMIRDEAIRGIMGQHIGENLPATRNAITSHQGLALFYVMEHLFNRNADLIDRLEKGNLTTPEQNFIDRAYVQGD